MTNLVRLTLHLLLAFWLSSPLAALSVEQYALAPLPDIAQILDRGKLRVAQTKEDVPLVFTTGKDGEISGFDVDLARAIAHQLGVELELHRTADSHDDVVRQVARGEVDMGISFLSRTARRGKYVLFSRPYLHQSMTLLINRVSGLKFRKKCPTVNEIGETMKLGHGIGAQTGSSYIARLRAYYPDLEVKEYHRTDEAIGAVLAGKIAVSLQGELAAKRFLSENPAARIRLRYCPIGRHADQIAIAVPPGHYGLLNWVNVFLDEKEINFQVPDLIEHEGPWNF